MNRYYYGSTSVADEFSDNNYPTVRVCLDGEMFARLFDHRERLITLCRQEPAPVSLVFNSDVEFGRIDHDGLPIEDQSLLDSGELVFIPSVRQEPDPEPSSGEYYPLFLPTQRGGEQTEVVSKSGVEFVWSPKYGRGSSFWVSWADLEVTYAGRPCCFPISEDVKALAAGILAEGATDRVSILADALDECGAPPWIGRGMREDRDWSNGWLHLVNAYEDRRPTEQKTPLIRSLAGMPPLVLDEPELTGPEDEEPDEEDEDAG